MSLIGRPADTPAETEVTDCIADHLICREQQTHRMPLLSVKAAAELHSQFCAKLILAAGLLAVPAFAATASEMGIVNGSLIWKAIPSMKGEVPWQACRRVFGQDVARSRPGTNGSVSCFVPYHSLYEYGQKRQNISQ